MIRVLFIAYEYPPLGGAGIRRSLILSRHLSEFGIEPVVLTTDTASYQRDKSDMVDMKLLDRIKPGLVVERIPTPAPKKRLRGRLGFWSQALFSLTDDVASRWQAEVKRRLPDLIARYQPVAVYATLPPFSMAPLACDIGEKACLPVLLDFRDSWSQCGHTPHTTWGHYQALLRLEHNCLERAAAVVCVTEQIKRDMLAVQPGQPTGKFRVIPNGFDAEVPDTVQVAAAGDSRPYVIGHVGSFYYSPAARQSMLNSWWKRKPTRWTHYSPRREDWLYRSPFFFFRALASLLERRPELRNRIRVRFVGATPGWLADQICESGLGDVVELLRYLSHKECLAFQSACDALLITSAKVIGGEDYCISSKTFEYVTTGKPVLAVVAPGAQRDFLLHSGVAQICDPDDLAGTAAQIETLAMGQGRFQIDKEFLAGYHAKAISQSMAAVLHEISSKAGKTVSG